VSVEMVNILSVELDEPLDEAGFRHVAVTVGPRLGAERIGASVYQAEAGSPIWPYHYHHGIEEWLYVIAGAPVLRDPAGERVLTPGDLVCFPSGHVGAHTVKGPGRFVIFATGQHVEPYMSVYPRLGQGQRPRGHPPPNERRRLLARRGSGGAVGARRDRAGAQGIAAAAGRERARPP